jgi:drug/metabolite transporter (DMT)-like permease
MLIDEGAGLIEIYLVRTVVAAVVFLIAFPPRNLGRPSVPGLVLRSAVMTAGWMASLLAVRAGSPTVVQTMAATTPLWVMGWESARSGRLPSLRVLGASMLVLVGVIVVSTTGN